MTKKSYPGITFYETEKINYRIRAKLYSIFLLLAWVPEIILNSYTIVIPKKVNAIDPIHLRPFSMASNMLLQFHKIIVKKINPEVKLTSYQFGFRPLDGVARGIDLFDSILRSVVDDIKPIAIAVIGLEKA